MLEQFDKLELHPLSEKIVDILVERTQTDDRNFFRILTAYHLTKIPSMLQAKIDSPDRGVIPINFYGINLAPSGHGKGYATNIFEDLILQDFIKEFMENLLPATAALNIEDLAIERDQDNNVDKSREKVQTEYERVGVYQPVFDSATAPAIKQLRHKILMSNLGSLNLEIDEIGSNISGSLEALGVYLELYDVGKVKDKLIKHTSDSKHTTPIKGVTPTNLMMFGTPTRLLNAAKEEDEFYSLLETGYARRCFFGYTRISSKRIVTDATKVYQSLVGGVNNAYLDQLKSSFSNFASPDFRHKKLGVPEPVAIRLIEYKLACEHEAMKFSEYDEIRKAEMTHRYFKTLKLAGTYAFIEGEDEISMEHLEAAIALAQHSGQAFSDLQKREKNYVKLAKFLDDKDEEVTHADMIEELPFFRGSNQYKQDMIKLAAAWAYKHNIVLKSYWTNGIEFLSANSLEKTNLDEIIVSVSKNLADGYHPKKIPFEKLVGFGKRDNYHWCNHHFKNNYRQKENTIPGFNILVFDVEKSVSLDMAKMLLKGYKAIFYTTRRHDPANHQDRYRVIIPTNYKLEMDDETYKEFMKNLYTWLPFDSDEQAGQRERKWLCHAGQVEVLDGEVFDVLPFIPQTEKNKERITKIIDDNSLDNLERWFVNNTAEGNRSNQLIRYALALVDGGKDIAEISQRIRDVNRKLPNPLEDRELQNTVLKTAARKITGK